MSRLDIADYLGLVVETVRRVLIPSKHNGLVATTDANRIKPVDRETREDRQGEI